MHLATALASLLIATAPLAAQADARVVRNWLTRSAHPLRTVEPTGDNSDLAPLHDIVRGARLIGIGESKHGMHELLQLRHRVLRWLVAHEGVTALAMESALAEGVAVDRWIVGDTDREPDFANTITFFGELVEIQDAFRWLREHNLRLPRERRVRYYGVDLSRGGGTVHPAIDSVWRWLDRVDPTFAGESRAMLGPVLARFGDATWPSLAARYDSLGAGGKDSLRRGVDALVAHIVDRGADYMARSPAVEYEWNTQLARTVQQLELEARLGVRDPSNPRDVAMATNVRWVLQRERRRGPVVLWAHNAHVQSVPIGGPAVPVAGGTMNMGTILRRALGPEYVRLGTAFATRDGDSTKVDPSSVDGMLASVGRRPFLIDLRAPRNATVERWLDAPHRMHFEYGDLDVAPRRAFDALFFVDRISPAHPVSR